MSAEFRQTDERLIHQGNVVGFFEGTFVGPDGEVFHRDIVRHPGAVSVVPFLDDGRVVLVRQFRAAMATELLEVPAGKRDVPDEPPELTARRELAEEVGLAAENLVALVSFAQSPGFCDEVNHVFLATGLSAVEGAAHGVEEQHMTVERVPLADTPGMISDGRIVDSKTIIGLLLAIRHTGTAT